MLTAGELLVKPRRIQARENAAETLAELFRSPEDALLVFDGARFAGIISPVSALRVAVYSCGSELKQLTAGDLVQDHAAPLSAQTSWLEFIKELCEAGALAVSEPDARLLGVITPKTLAMKLGLRAADLEREIDILINCSSDEILVADGTGTVLRANVVFEEHFGVKVVEVLGKKVGELEEKRVFFPSVTRLVLQKKTVQTVIQSQRNGRKFLATGTPAFNPDGSIFRVIVNTRDITRLNKLKQQLEEAELLKKSYYQELIELRRGHTASADLLISSEPMLELVKTARKIALVDSTVLLTGESGVGKGIIAHYIHEYSPRCEKPFITVNCGAIPENLLESELFGYAPGAFTGAHREGKIGKLELAHEGTLFLDEITDLPLNMQVKLLHVIQEGIINRIGDTREIRLNLRIIAATNREIEQLVSRGKFREDLYFRLNVIPLEIPPLRERADDVKALSRHFLEKFNHKYRKQKQLDPAIFPYLKTYRWPGNVRELENLVERMVIVVDEAVIGFEHLPRPIFGQKEVAVPPVLSALPLQPLKQAREALEQELLRQALRRCRTTYEMASALGVDQSTVVRKLKKYKLPSPNVEIHQD